LIPFLARRSRIDEALDLCDQAAGMTGGLELARVSLAALRAGKATADQVQRVERQIVAAANEADPAARTGYDLVLAELREIQGRYDDMSGIYRKLIEDNERNVLALNNLAWFQSFEPADRGSSLDLINRAIRLAGPDPELL